MVLHLLPFTCHSYYCGWRPAEKRLWPHALLCGCVNVFAIRHCYHSSIAAERVSRARAHTHTHTHTKRKKQHQQFAHSSKPFSLVISYHFQCARFECDVYHTPVAVQQSGKLGHLSPTSAEERVEENNDTCACSSRLALNASRYGKRKKLPVWTKDERTCRLAP